MVINPRKKNNRFPLFLRKVLLGIAALVFILSGAFGETESIKYRVVDFGHDYGRSWDLPAFGGGRPAYQGGWVNITDRNLDGNAGTQDWIEAIAFSMQYPFSPGDSFWDETVTCAKFYGGISFRYANRSPSSSKGITEKHINILESEHHDKPSDNWALHMFTGKDDSPWTGCASWIWKKEDFVGPAKGAGATVKFDSESYIHLYSQRYYGGYDGRRFIVQEGGQFYISENLDAYNIWKGDPDYYGDYRFRPSDLQWAQWNPQEGSVDFAFEEGGASFAYREFNDIRAAGWYLFKSQNNSSVAACKWESFEVFATVVVEKAASHDFPMSEVGGGSVDGVAVEPFFIAQTETSYRIWASQYRWATSPQYASTPGYTFLKDGDMGSMDYGFESHSHAEPVTDITIYDALLWCNSLSEREGREVVYYEDAAFTKPFHHAAYSEWFKPGYRKTLPTVYVKWAADGYRLPTEAEWKLALAGETFSAERAWAGGNSGGKTHPCGGKSSNANGLKDMLGNVWEYVWAYGDSLAPNPATVTVWGGGFTHSGTANHLSPAGSPYGDKPYDGHFHIGLRPVRRAAGCGVPAVGTIADPANIRWSIASSDVATGGAAQPTVSLGIVPVVADGQYGHFKREGNAFYMFPFEMGSTEVTYRQWKTVRDWAEANGYTFDHDGDMGSMDYKDLTATHSPDEPVTDVSWHDSVCWLNALSEMQGKTPVYYADAGRSTVYRNAHFYRPSLWRHKEQSTYTKNPGDSGNWKLDVFYNTTIHTDPADDIPHYLVHLKWDADGYRLPTYAEQAYAYGGYDFQAEDDEARHWVYPWGNDAGELDDHVWHSLNSGDKTQVAGTKSPNAFGLYDMAGNVVEWCSDFSVQDMTDLDSPIAFVQVTSPVLGIFGREVSPMTHYLNASIRNDRNPLKYKRVEANALAQIGGSAPTNPYPDLGLRIARSTGTEADHQYHPLGRDPNLKEYRAYPELDVDYNSYDPLEGKTMRGNLKRDGIFQTSGVAELGGVKWKFQTGGAVRSSAVLVDGIVYIGSNDGYFYALNAASGAVVWRINTGAKVVGSACVAGDSVYFNNEVGELYRVEKQTGRVLWSVDFTDADRKTHGTPAVAYGIVFAAMGSNADLGEVSMTGGPMVGFDVETGKEVWRTILPIRGLQNLGSPAIYRDLLAIHDATQGWGISLSEGTTVYMTPIEGNSKASSSSTISVKNGEVRAYVTGPLAGAVHQFDTAHSASLWSAYAWSPQKSMKDGGSPGHELFSQATVVGDTMYLNCADGTLYTLFTENQGRNNSNVQRGWSLGLGYAGTFSSAAVAGGHIYFGSNDGKVFAVETRAWNEAAPAAPAWSFQAGGAVYSSPCAGDGTLFFGSDDGYVYCLEAAVSPKLTLAGPESTVLSAGAASMNLAASAASGLTVQWSDAGATGNVSFANAAAGNTVVTFSAPGTYRLVVTATDPSNPATSYTKGVTVIVAPSAAQEGSLLSYSFEEGAGTSVGDSSGGNRTGTISGGAAWEAAGGVSGKALRFDGVNDVVAVGNATALNFNPRSGVFSIGLWFKANEGLTGASLFSKAFGNTAGGSLQYSMGIDGEGRLVIASRIVSLTGGKVNDGGWHHAVWVNETGGVMKLYLDGQYQGSVVTETDVTTSADVLLGARRGASNAATEGFFAGLIDEVAVFASALTAAEVASLYVAELNLAPVVSAAVAPGTTIKQSQTLTLDGTAADDGKPSGALSYAWSKLSGPSGGTVSFASASSLDTTATFSTPGDYSLALTVSDGGASSSAVVNIVVTSASDNRRPAVTAGASVSGQPKAAIALAATASDDGKPTSSLTYLWEVLTKPTGATATFANAAAEDTTVTVSKAGDYSLRLTVSDGELSATAAVALSAAYPAADNYIPIKGMAFHLALAELDGDAEKELVYGTVDDGFVRAIDPVAETQIWEREIGGFIHNVSVGDLTGDGKSEVFCSSSNGKAYCLNSDGSVRWSYDMYFPATIAAMLSVDGEKVILAGGFGKDLYLLSSSGALLKTIAETDAPSHLFVHDGDGDGDDEAYVVIGMGELSVLDFAKNGASWDYSTVREGKVVDGLNRGDNPWSMVWGDVTNDGVEDTVIGCHWVEMGGLRQAINVQNPICTQRLRSGTGLDVPTIDAERRRDYFAATNVAIADVIGDENQDGTDENPGNEVIAIAGGNLRIFNFSNTAYYIEKDHNLASTKAYGPSIHTYPANDSKYTYNLNRPWSEQYRYLIDGSQAITTMVQDGRVLYLGSSVCGDEMLYRLDLDSPGWMEQFRTIQRQGNMEHITDNLMSLKDETLAYTPDPAKQAAALSYGPYRKQVHFTKEQGILDNAAKMRASYPYYMPNGEHFVFTLGQVWSGFGHTYSIAQMQAELASWEAAGAKVLLGCAHGTGLFCQNADGTWTDSPIIADAAMAAAPTALYGFASSEDGTGYLPDKYVWKGNINSMYEKFHKPLMDSCVTHEREHLFDEKGYWWMSFAAKPETFDMLFGGERWRYTTATTEDSNNETSSLNLMSIFGLKQAGLIQRFLTFCIADDYRVAGSGIEWSYTRHGSPFFRKLVAWTALGSYGWHIRYGEGYRDTVAKKDEITQVTKESADIFYHLLGKGVLWAPKPSEMAGTCPVGFLFHYGSAYFPPTQNARSYAKEVPEQTDAVLNRITELWALAPTPEYSLEKLLFDKKIQGHDNIPATPYGPVVITPSYTDPESVRGVKSWWHTDGVYVWKDPANKLLGQAAFDAVKADLEAQSAALPFRARWTGDNRVFFHTLNPEFDKNLYRIVAVDADWLDPNDKVVNVTTQLPGDWEVRDTLTGEIVCPAGVREFSLAVPGGAARFLDARPASPNGIVVSATAVSVPEGGTAQFQVKLQAAPAGGSCTVDVAPLVTRFSTNNIRVTSGGALVFTSANWDQWQTVTLATEWDEDSTSNEVTIRANAFGLSYRDVAATQADSGVALAVVVSPAEIDVPEGGSGSTTVKLSRAPLANTTVTIAKTGGDGDIALTSASTLTFTTANWNTPQTVAFSAGQDYDTGDGGASYLCSIDGGRPAVLTVNEADDAVRILVDFGSVDLQVLGAGWNNIISSTGTIASLVDAKGAPTGVSLSVVGGFSTVINTSGVKDGFRSTARNDGFAVQAGQTAGAFKLTGLVPTRLYTLGFLGLSNTVGTVTDYGTTADYFIPGPQIGYLTCGVNQGVVAELLDLVPTENKIDVAVTTKWHDLNTAMGALEISWEQGGVERKAFVDFGPVETPTAGNWNNMSDYSTNATLNLIDDQGNPTGLTLVITDGFEGYRTDGAGTGLIFPTTAENDGFWLYGSRLAVPENPLVEVGGLRIDGIDPALRYSLRFFGSISDENGTLLFTVANDTLSGGMKVVGQDNYEAVDALATQENIRPSAGGEIEIFVEPQGASAQGMLNVFQLSWVDETSGETESVLFDFGSPALPTSDDWNNVTETTTGQKVAGAVNSVGGATGIGLSVTAAFGGIVEEVHPLVTPYPEDAQVDGLYVAPGGTGTLRLGNIPNSNPFDLTFFGSSTADNYQIVLSADGKSVTLYNTDNHSEVVSLVGVDSNGETSLDILAQTPAGAARGVVGVLEIAFEPGEEMELSTSSISVPEGGTASFGMRLNKQPLANVTASVVRTTGDADIAPVTTTLTFTPVNWNQWQNVVIGAAQDSDTLPDVATLRCSLSNGDWQAVQATEADDDVAILVEPAILNVPEGGTATFQVKLSQRPRGPLNIVTAWQSGDGDIGIGGGEVLSFAQDAWDTWQTVTLSGGNDADDENGQALFALTGADIPASIIAIEADSGRIEGALGIYTFPGTNPGDDSKTPHTEGNAKPRLTFSEFRRTGDIAVYARDDAFGIQNCTVSTSLVGGEYTSFTVALDPGWMMALYRLGFDLTSGASGPAYTRVEVRVDGAVVATQDFGKTGSFVFDFADFVVTDAQSLEFRFYGWGANAAGTVTQRFRYYDNIALYGRVTQFDGSSVPVMLGTYKFTGTGTAGDTATPHTEGNAAADTSFAPFALAAGGGTLAASATNGDGVLAVSNWKNGLDRDAGEYLSFTVATSLNRRLELQDLDFDIRRVSTDSPSKFRVEVLKDGVSLESFDFNVFDTQQKTLGFRFADFTADYGQGVEFRFYAWGGTSGVASQVLVDNVSLWGAVLTTQPKLAVMDDGAILEGAESGETVLVTISDGQFAPTLSLGNWALSNLPQGVSVASVTRVSDTVVRLTLIGNRTRDYDTDKSSQLTVAAGEIAGASVMPPILGSRVQFTALNDAESISVVTDGSIVEGSESGEILEVTLVGGTFASPQTAANWTISGAPAGVGVGSVTRLDATHARVVLSGNASADYDVEKRATLSCSAAEVDDFATGSLTTSDSIVFAQVYEIEPASAFAALPGNTRNYLSWTPPGIPTFVGVVVLGRSGGAVQTAALTDGQTYSAGATVGGDTVLYVGPLTSFVHEGVANGAAQHYRVFAYDGNLAYSTPASATATATDILGSYLFTGTGTAGDALTPHNEGNAVGHSVFTPFALVKGSATTLEISGNQSDGVLSARYWPATKSVVDYLKATVAPSAGYLLSLRSCSMDVTRYSSTTSATSYRLELYWGGQLHASQEYSSSDVLPKTLSFDFADVVVTASQPAELRFTAWGGTTGSSSYVQLDNVRWNGSVYPEPPHISFTAESGSAISEGAENGAVLFADLHSGVYAEALDAAAWQISALPQGVSIGSVTRESGTRARIVLSGNRTKDYDTSVTMNRVTAAASQVADAEVEIETSSTGVGFAALDDAEAIALSQVAAISEGAENGKTVTVTLVGGTFAPSLTLGNWSIANQPAGVVLGSVNRDSVTQATLTLSGNATEDYDVAKTNLTVTCTEAEVDDHVGAALSASGGVVFTPVIELGAVSAFTASPGNGQAFLSWTNPLVSSNLGTMVLRSTAPVTEVPQNGQAYAKGGTVGAATVVYVGGGEGCTDTGLTNGTTHHYKSFSYGADYTYLSGPSASVVPTAMLGSYLFTGTGTTGDAKTPNTEGTAAANITFGAFALVKEGADTINFRGTNGDNNLNVQYFSVDAACNATQYLAFTVAPATGHALRLDQMSMDVARTSATYSAKNLRVELRRGGSVVATQDFLNLSGTAAQTLSFDFANVLCSIGESVEFRIYGWGAGVNSTNQVQFDNVIVQGRVLTPSEVRAGITVASFRAGQSLGQQEVRAMIAGWNADVLLLSDVESEAAVDLLKTGMDVATGYSYYKYYPSGQTGVKMAALGRYPFVVSEDCGASADDPDGKIANALPHIAVMVDGERLDLFGLCAVAPDQKTAHAQEAQEVLRVVNGKTSHLRTVVIGDFASRGKADGAVHDEASASYAAEGQAYPNTASSDAFLAAGYVDAWRSLNPGKAAPATKIVKLEEVANPNAGERVDYAMVSPGLSILGAGVMKEGKNLYSDHKAVWVRLGTGGSAVTMGGSPVSCGPEIQASSLATGNGSVEITFSEGVYANNNATGALTVAHFEASLEKTSLGRATGVSISAVEHTPGASAARVYLTVAGSPNGEERVRVYLAGNHAAAQSKAPAHIYSSAGVSDLWTRYKNGVPYAGVQRTDRFALYTPEMGVSRGLPIAGGASDSVAESEVGVPVTLTYSISNTGKGALLLAGDFAVTGAANCSVEVVAQPVSTIAPFASGTLLLRVTPQGAGAWSFGVSGSSNDTDEGTYAWTVQGTATLAGFAGWVAQRGLAGGDAAASADPDKDGISNLIEYALGGSPTVRSASVLPQVAVENGNLTMTYRKNKAAGDLAYTVQSSTDLTTWTNEDIAVKVSDLDAETESWKATKALGGQRLFLRLRVTR